MSCNSIRVDSTGGSARFRRSKKTPARQVYVTPTVTVFTILPIWKTQKSRKSLGRVSVYELGSISRIVVGHVSIVSQPRGGVRSITDMEDPEMQKIAR